MFSLPVDMFVLDVSIFSFYDCLSLDPSLVTILLLLIYLKTDEIGEKLYVILSGTVGIYFP